MFGYLRGDRLVGAGRTRAGGDSAPIIVAGTASLQGAVLARTLGVPVPPFVAAAPGVLAIITGSAAQQGLVPGDG